MVFIGETKVSDVTLCEEVDNCVACRITREHPDYDAYTTNCQNFVVCLLKVACPGRQSKTKRPV